MREPIQEDDIFPDAAGNVDTIRPTNVRRGSIRLTYRMAFNLACEHENHPTRITFAKDALLGAELWSSGEAVVTGVFADHTFRFSRDQYEVV